MSQSQLLRHSTNHRFVPDRSHKRQTWVNQNQRYALISTQTWCALQ
ncbi:hypothetical protein H6F87_10705 [Cyanobacteria bacterium FACHB-502]|nr:hypothetical protein [Cyanobacteria bacterium FACHB-502]